MTALQTRRRNHLRRNVALLFYKAYADLRAEAERTYVGFLWWVVEPVASMIVYYVVFSVILERGGPDYVSFLLAGVVPWRFFQTTILHGANSILSSRGLMQQVFLPKAILPSVDVLVDTFKFLVVFVLLALYMIVTAHPVTLAYFALPILIIVQFSLVAGLTLLAACVTPFIPDLRLVLQNLLRLLFFMSGVFYDLDRFSDQTQTYLRLNPMAVMLESYRTVLIDGQWPRFSPLASILAISLATVAAGFYLIHRLEYVFPKLQG
jgi:lipopolysaccharide transport system permease protein